MSKKSEKIELVCAFCNAIDGVYEQKYVPKSFVSSECKIGQVTVQPGKIGHSRGRNYPEGYFDG